MDPKTSLFLRWTSVSAFQSRCFFEGRKVKGVDEEVKSPFSGDGKRKIKSPLPGGLRMAQNETRSLTKSRMMEVKTFFRDNCRVTLWFIYVCVVLDAAKSSTKDKGQSCQAKRNDIQGV